MQMTKTSSKKTPLQANTPVNGVPVQKHSENASRYLKKTTLKFSIYRRKKEEKNPQQLGIAMLGEELGVISIITYDLSFCCA